jgi:hypothetical protein
MASISRTLALVAEGFVGVLGGDRHQDLQRGGIRRPCRVMFATPDLVPAAPIRPRDQLLNVRQSEGGIDARLMKRRQDDAKPHVCVVVIASCDQGLAAFWEADWWVKSGDGHMWEGEARVVWGEEDMHLRDRVR